MFDAYRLTRITAEDLDQLPKLRSIEDVSLLELDEETLALLERRGIKAE